MKQSPRVLGVVTLITSLFVAFLLLLQVAPAAPVAAAEPVPAGLAQGAQPLSNVERASFTLDVAVEELMEKDVARVQQGLPPHFAYPISADVTPTTRGTWETLADGTRLWRLRVHSPDALSLNLGFARYSMPTGGKLYFYTPDYYIIRGPFTAADNEAHGQLWSPIVAGDEVVIEVQVPAGQVSALALNLSSVNHGYAELGNPEARLSGACNLDVVCSAADGFPEVDPWREQIRSVGVYTLNGIWTCSGALVNNTAQDLTPYFLTADHCGISGGNAATMVVYWNYENSTCRQPGSAESGQPGDGDLSQFNTGAIFRADYAPSDFSLVELDDPVDPAYNPYFAGWDATSDDYTNAIAIHHPNTDEKRISFEDDATQTTSYGGSTVPGDGTHIRVIDWDLGTTEPGSSGSPLFNPEQRIVGQLHGGGAACGNDLSDWYGRVSVSWDGGGTDATRLSTWLDPLDTGVLVLDGRNVAADFNLSVTPDSIAICVGDDAMYDVTVGSVENFSDTVSLSALGVPTGADATFSVNNQPAPYSSTLTISNTGSAAAGTYSIDIVGMAPTSTHTATVQLEVADEAPEQVQLLSPMDGETDVPTSPTLTWVDAAQATEYTVEVATDPAFNDIVDSATVADTTYDVAVSLDPNSTYYWRVTAENLCGVGQTSEVWSFTTANQICSVPNVAIPDNSPGGVSDMLSVADSGTLTNLNVYLRADHTYVGDLIFTLEHDGTTIDLIDRPGRVDTGFGCSGDNIDNTADDSATLTFEDDCVGSDPAYTPGEHYQPNDPLATFIGMDLNGDWTLTVSDNAGQDLGTLIEWCLIPSVEPPPTAITLSNLGEGRSSNAPLLAAVALLGLTVTGLLWRRRQA